MQAQSKPNANLPRPHRRDVKRAMRGDKKICQVVLPYKKTVALARCDHGLFTASGQYRTRTYDPTDVNRVLYQLSQLPLMVAILYFTRQVSSIRLYDANVCLFRDSMHHTSRSARDTWDTAVADFRDDCFIMGVSHENDI
jgi:hypothetical protein